MTPHGTYPRWQQGCRCIDCRDACLTYHRERHGYTNPGHGMMLTVNKAKLRALLDGEDVKEIERQYNVRIDHLLGRQNTCGLYTLDRIACALGTHYALLTLDDIASMEETA